MILERIHYILLALLFIFLPIRQPGFMAFFIGLLTILLIFRIRPKRKVEWLNVFFLGTGIFAIQLLSLLWTDNFDAGKSTIETQLALFFVPLIFGLSPPVNRSYSEFIKACFILGLFGSLLIHVSNGFVNSWEENDYSYLTYAKLSGVIHASYLSLYFVCGLCVLLFTSTFNFVKPALQNILRAVLAILFVVFIVLLSSKAGLLSTLVVLCLAIFLCVRKVKALKGRLALSAALMVILVGGILISPATLSRVKASIPAKTKAVEKQVEVNDTLLVKRSSTDSRLISWRSSAGILLRNPAGVGVGDSKDVLIKSYEEKGELYLLKKKLNSHNQFFQLGLSSGWIGILILMLGLILFYYKALNQKDWLLLSVLIAITINLLTESMFDRESGAVFIPLMLSFLVFRDRGFSSNTPLDKDENLTL